MSLDIDLITPDGKLVYEANITHNLNTMAEAAGIYKHIWRPEELGIKKAQELIQPLIDGLKKLVSDRERFQQYNPPNKWGSYDTLFKFVDNYLDACINTPDARIEISR